MDKLPVKITTGQAAKEPGVTLKTILRWCESGRLKYELTKGGFSC